MEAHLFSYILFISFLFLTTFYMLSCAGCFVALQEQCYCHHIRESFPKRCISSLSPELFPLDISNATLDNWASINHFVERAFSKKTVLYLENTCTSIPWWINSTSLICSESECVRKLHVLLTTCVWESNIKYIVFMFNLYFVTRWGPLFSTFSFLMFALIFSELTRCKVQWTERRRAFSSKVHLLVCSCYFFYFVLTPLTVAWRRTRTSS